MVPEKPLGQRPTGRGRQTSGAPRRARPSAGICGRRHLHAPGSVERAARAALVDSRSVRQAYMVDFGVTLPRLAGVKSFVDLYSVHYDYPNMQFYGEGPESSKDGRSVYRLENHVASGAFWIPAAARLDDGRQSTFIQVGRYIQYD